MGHALRQRSVGPSFDLGRAVERWLVDGKPDGWTARTLSNRRFHVMQVLWSLEHEVGVAPWVGALTPDCFARFQSKVRQPHPEGRFGSSHPPKGAQRSRIRTWNRPTAPPVQRTARN
jgi:hypothetical protein